MAYERSVALSARTAGNRQVAHRVPVALMTPASNPQSVCDKSSMDGAAARPQPAAQTVDQSINVPPLVQTQMLIAVHCVPSWKGDQIPINPRISHFELESTAYTKFIR